MLILISLIIPMALGHSLPELKMAKRSNGHVNGRSVLADVLQKRQQGTTDSTNIFDVWSWSSGGGYYINVTVGSPPQEQTVLLDTGSSDLYFDTPTASECTLPLTDPRSCQGGTFDLSKSTTYREAIPAPAFNTSFGDGSTAVGPYGQDVVAIGNVVLDSIQFGVAADVNSTTGYAIGLMGVGYSSNEAVSNGNYYPNMPENLQRAGVINSRLYSVFLNDVAAISGTLLFGGIDRAKFTGNLATLNLIPAGNTAELLNAPIKEFVTTITAASGSFGGQIKELWSGGSADANAYNSGDTALPVLLDTGSAAWSVPQSIFNNFIAPNFPYIDSHGRTSCSNAHSGDSFNLTFGGQVSITVPASEFIVPLIDPATRKAIPYNGTSDDTCIFLINPSPGSGNFWIAGDAVLRSMYVVYDLDNGQVSIAQAAVNATTSDAVVVPAGPNGVASALSSGVLTAPTNTASIAPAVQNATISITAKTTDAFGTATGVAAVPTAAQVVPATGGAPAGSTIVSSGIWVAGLALAGGIMLL